MGRSFFLAHGLTGAIFAAVMLALLSAVSRQPGPAWELVAVSVVLAYLAALPATVALCRRRAAPGTRRGSGKGFTLASGTRRNA